MKHDVEQIQAWFGAVLRQPIDLESRLQDSIEVGLTPAYILPSPTLNPRERIEIYAQQYWWRLYKVLQEHYPLVVRLFGAGGFNEKIAKPFLLKNPPNHWNINYLGEGLADWLEEAYFEPDKELIVSAARIDWSWTASFLAPKHPLPTNENEPLYLSNSTYIFNLKWSLFEFRKQLLEHEPDWWIDHDFPELKKGQPYYSILWRTPKGNIAIEELNETEFKLLQEFTNGLSLNDLCKKYDKKYPKKNHLVETLARFFKRGVFTPTPRSLFHSPTENQP